MNKRDDLNTELHNAELRLDELDLDKESHEDALRDIRRRQAATRMRRDDILAKLGELDEEESQEDRSLSALHNALNLAEAEGRAVHTHNVESLRRAIRAAERMGAKR